jgi:nucleotide-binding universal stress UspA family protein
MLMSANKVVVGYDGTPGAAYALSWALDEAWRRHATVELVYAFVWPSYAPAASMVPGTVMWPDMDAERVVNDMLAAAVDKAGFDHPDVPVTFVSEHGSATLVLQHRSENAALLVVGGHSHGAFAELILGSVAAAIAAHAFCSVVVVRDPGRPMDDQPVVLGLDESAHAEAAAQFAFEQAAVHGVALRAVHAWMPPMDPWIGTPSVDPEEMAAAEQVWAEDLLAGWKTEFPSVPVVVTSVVGHPYKVLTESARDARLVVVGARGRGGFRDLRLGSVTRYVLHHGTGTVAVVR